MKYIVALPFIFPVSILIQPEGWMLYGKNLKQIAKELVSILIQPEGWMLLAIVTGGTV